MYQFMTSEIEFYLLTHSNELLKASNTGQLLIDLPQPVTIGKWSRVVAPEDLLQKINHPQYHTRLVFPETFAIYHQQKSEPITAPVDSAMTNLFLLLDGTWQQARKIYRQSPYLHQLPLHSLQTDKKSLYTLRRNQQDQGLCTAEVVATILEQEGYEEEGESITRKLVSFCEDFRTKPSITA